MRGSRGVTEGPDTPPPSEKSQKYRVSWQYLYGSAENQKATKPAFNVGPSSARQRKAIPMGFHWRADDGPLIVIFGSSLPLSTKNKHKKHNVVKVGNCLDPSMDELSM